MFLSTGMAALAWQMFDDAAFGIVHAFDFEQRVRATGLVLRSRLPEYQPLATERFCVHARGTRFA